MKALQIVTGGLAVGLAAAFSVAPSGPRTPTSTSTYIVSGDVISVVGAVAGALLLALAAGLFYRAVRPS